MEPAPPGKKGKVKDTDEGHLGHAALRAKRVIAPVSPGCPISVHWRPDGPLLTRREEQTQGHPLSPGREVLTVIHVTEED